MKEQLHAYKVAMIVLAVVAGIALITIIVLIRYFIIRQRTASKYQLLCFPIVYNCLISRVCLMHLFLRICRVELACLV